MILHVDGNSFYCSCERLFRPDLRNKPVIVLSNNDGIIIALTDEAKAIGLKRGDAFFKKKKFCEENGVCVFSSNYTLYADISYRLNSIYSVFAEKTEIYSIDESFLFIPDFVNFNYSQFALFLKNLIWKQLGIPVSVGIAPTKTLAKMCNKLAKNNGGVFNWYECNQTDTLKNFSVDKVWNIGRAKAEFLKKSGITNALLLSQLSLDKAKKYMTISGMKTVMELNGKECIEYIKRSESQNIVSSRSFQKAVYDLEEILEAVTYFCRNAVRKLREEKQCCSSIYVTLSTAAPFECDFNPELHYFNGSGKRLEKATSYLPEITEEACKLLTNIYRCGYGYRKASVNLLGLQKESQNLKLFEFEEEKKKELYDAIMDSFDRVNSKFGKESLSIAQGLKVREEKENWELKREFKSPDYTTDIKAFPEVL